jgi:hypothetical protein
MNDICKYIERKIFTHLSIFQNKKKKKTVQKMKEVEQKFAYYMLELNAERGVVPIVDNARM